MSIPNTLGLWDCLPRIGKLDAVFPNEGPDSFPPSVREEEAIEIERRFQEGNPNANLQLSLF
jgi:hypothetical protein